MLNKSHVLSNLIFIYGISSQIMEMLQMESDKFESLCEGLGLCPEVRDLWEEIDDLNSVLTYALSEEIDLEASLEICHKRDLRNHRWLNRKKNCEKSRKTTISRLDKEKRRIREERLLKDEMLLEAEASMEGPSEPQHTDFDDIFGEELEFVFQ